MRLRQRRGLVLVDTWYPEWRGYVNADLLDMSDHSRCVLGQLPFGYVEVLQHLSGLTDWRMIHRFAWSYGLDVSYADATEHPEVDPYELLTTMWRRDLQRAEAS